MYRKPLQLFELRVRLIWSPIAWESPSGPGTESLLRHTTDSTRARGIQKMRKYLLSLCALGAAGAMTLVSDAAARERPEVVFQTKHRCHDSTVDIRVERNVIRSA